MHYPTAIIKKATKREEPKTVEVEAARMVNVISVQDFMIARTSGNFAGFAIYLSDAYEYVLAKDNTGTTILIPLRKET